MDVSRVGYPVSVPTDLRVKVRDLCKNSKENHYANFTPVMFPVLLLEMQVSRWGALLEQVGLKKQNIKMLVKQLLCTWALSGIGLRENQQSRAM